MFTITCQIVDLDTDSHTRCTSDVRYSRHGVQWHHNHHPAFMSLWYSETSGERSDSIKGEPTAVPRRSNNDDCANIEPTLDKSLVFTRQQRRNIYTRFLSFVYLWPVIKTELAQCHWVNVWYLWDTRRWPNVRLILSHSLRRCANINTTSLEHDVFDRMVGHNLQTIWGGDPEKNIHHRSRGDLIIITAERGRKGPHSDWCLWYCSFSKWYQ